MTSSLPIRIRPERTPAPASRFYDYPNNPEGDSRISESIYISQAMSIRSPRGSTANPQASPPAAVHNLRDRNSRRLNSKVYQPKRKPGLKGLKVLLEEPPNTPPPLPLHGPPAHIEVSTLHEPHKLHKEISGQKSSNGARPQRPPAKGFDDYKLETEFHDDHVILKTYQWEFESSTRICEESKWKRLWVIGAGASGEIWLEEEQKLGRFRAVKQLRRRLKADFTRELLAFVKLREHPHLFVQFLGWYENRENIFLAMEYIRHGNLAEYIRSQSKPMVIEANEITKQILEGLKVLHAKGICHRDLKPENVLMASIHPIWIKIADFGISKRTKDTFLRTRCGTDGYLAPELLGIFPGQETYTHALDIWSLGSMVYEMCTSLKPFHHLEGGAGTDATIYTGLEESIKQPVLDMTSLIEYCKGVKDFPSKALEASGISREGIILIKSLLTPAPEGRATADSALKSPWLKGYTDYWLKCLEAELLSICANLDRMRPIEDLLLRKAGNVDIMKYLSTTPVEVFPVLLRKAVQKGHNIATTMLLRSQSRKSIDPSTRGELFRSAAEAEHLDIMNTLVHYEMDIGALIDGKAVLEWLFRFRHHQMIEILLKNQRAGARTILQAAAEGGYSDYVKFLITNYYDVNEPAADNAGRTALQAAAGAGHMDIVEILLDRCSEINAPAAGENGRTALQAAAEGGHADIVKLLLKKGAYANAEAGSYKGLRALEAAKISNNSLIIKLIKESLENDPYYTREKDPLPYV